MATYNNHSSVEMTITFIASFKKDNLTLCQEKKPTPLFL